MASALTFSTSSVVVVPLRASLAMKSRTASTISCRPPVAHGDVNGHTSVGFGLFGGHAEPVGYVFGQQVEVPNESHATVSVRGGEFGNNVTDDVEQELEFFGIAPQVFGGEQVDGDQFHIGVGAPGYEFPNFFRTHPMSVADVDKPGFPSPSAVAVAHDCDVFGSFNAGDFPQQSPFVEGV